MRLSKLLLLVLILGFTSASYAQTESWDTLSTKEYSISFPTGWTVDTTGLMSTKFFIYDVPTSTEGNLFSANVNLMTESIEDSDLTFEQYATQSKDYLSNFVTDFDLISSEFTEKDGNSLYTIIYTNTQGNFKLFFHQQLQFHNSDAYFVTFTSKKSQREEYQAIAEKIMDSFRLEVDNK